jgi:hypothetical protein
MKVLTRFMDSTEIEPRIVEAVVARCSQGALEPGFGFVVMPLFHKVNTDVVVWIAEIRIDANGAAA